LEIPGLVSCREILQADSHVHGISAKVTIRSYFMEHEIN
jgi:hypothetical protein